MHETSFPLSSSPLINHPAISSNLPVYTSQHPNFSHLHHCFCKLGFPFILILGITPHLVGRRRVVPKHLVGGEEAAVGLQVVVVGRVHQFRAAGVQGHHQVTVPAPFWALLF